MPSPASRAGSWTRCTPGARGAKLDSGRHVSCGQGLPPRPNAYTQGLIYRDGFLYESTGLVGRSSLRKVKLETGEVVQQRRIDQAHFAEGLADWKGQLVQLTWQSNVAFVYELATFAPRRTLQLLGRRLGSHARWREIHPQRRHQSVAVSRSRTFREIGRVDGHRRQDPIRDLNELEYVRGEVYANVWHTDRIARISPESGRVIRLDGPARSDVRGLPARFGGGAERHCA